MSELEQVQQVEEQPAPAVEEQQPVLEQQAAPEPEPHEQDPKTAAIVALRREVQELKPLAQKAQALEQELAGSRPYLEFVKQNWDKLQARPQPVTPQPDPAVDKDLETFARRYELYTTDGRPDVDRARAIVDDNRKVAREEAQKVIQPYEQRSLADTAAARLEHIRTQKDAFGRPLTDDSLAAAIEPLVKGMSVDARLKAMADPQVAELITRQAKAIQLEKLGIPNQQQAPQPGTPLYVESPGGGSRPTMSESERRFAKSVGRSEKDWLAANARIKPGQSNALED